ncbi:MAG: energy transducer TonB [Thermodesulfobacteriota bacterium]|jgi:TonB family protein
MSTLINPRETKIAVEEKTPKEIVGVIKEKGPIPADEKPEMEVAVKEKPPEKLDDVIKEEKPIPVYTKPETKSVVGKKMSDEREKLVDTPKQERTPHDLEQSIANQYVRDHFDSINNLIRLNIPYPYRARKLSMEGRVIVSFVVRLDGSIKDIIIEQSSGHSILDNNVIRAVKKAVPFPPPPVEAKVIIPITYRLGTVVP